MKTPKSIFPLPLSTISPEQHTPRRRHTVQTGLEMHAHEPAERLDESREIGLQILETGQFLQGLLIHIERAVDLDLQAVPVLGGAALAAHDLDALITLVDAHVVTKAAQEVGDEIGEIAGAGRAIAVAEHEIAVPVLAMGAMRWHRMAVDVPHRAKFAMQSPASLVEHAMVGRVIALDPGENVVGAELFVVDRHAGLRMAAH